MVLTDQLRMEYARLFAGCEIRPERAAEVDDLVDALLADRDRYRAVGEPLAIPWFVVAATHCADTDRDFNVHLHNGDCLTERTSHVPNGRPLLGEPPFVWEDSAIDALRLDYVDQWRDWSVSGVLFVLEGHDGWSYRLRQPQVLSPYLWNYSTHYSQGKYVGDDAWNETAIASRCGVAVLLRRLAERGSIAFLGDDQASSQTAWHYNPTERSATVEALQRFLNTLPGVFVKVDGLAGPRTSEAFHQLSGHYLADDPRAAGARELASVQPSLDESPPLAVETARPSSIPKRL